MSLRIALATKKAQSGRYKAAKVEHAEHIHLKTYVQLLHQHKYSAAPDNTSHNVSLLGERMT